MKIITSMLRRRCRMLRSPSFITCAFFLLGSLCAAQTVSTFDVLVATETLTVIGTTTFHGNAFSVGSSSFVVSQGNVGIATAAPGGLFTVGNGTITVLNSGFVGISTTTPVAQLHMVGSGYLGTPDQLQWISTLGALKAGGSLGTYGSAAWDHSRIGPWSLAFGVDQYNTAIESTLAGGQDNVLQQDQSFIGSGYNNQILGISGIGPDDSVIVGGAYNTTFSGAYSFIGGGTYNVAEGTGSVVTGGGVLPNFSPAGNTASGTSSVISGGINNAASGDYSSVPGGSGNTASGRYSFAAGQQSTAAGQGSFVWADSQNLPFASTTSDEFKVRAQGGFVFYSTWTAPTIIVSSGSILISTSATAMTAAPNIFISSITGNVGIETETPQAQLEVAGSAQVDGVFALTTTTAMNLPSGSTGQRQASPTSGAIRFNSTTNVIEYFDGTYWRTIQATSLCSGTGGVVTVVNGQCIHTFTTSGIFTAPTSTNAAILVVSGGGGASEGGGGAGGVLYNPSFPISGSMTVTIGAGGVGQSGNGTQGSASSFGSTSTVGGGYGGWGGAGGNGGSGGGGGNPNGAGGSVSGSGYVHAGGSGGPGGLSPYPCGGGGGAGAVGGNGTGTVAGNGGNGVAISISGTSVYYGGGGAGSLFASGTNGTGGLGGGGNVGANGSAGTGGGGGACTIGGSPPCGNGGSGIVIVSYSVQ